MKPKVRVRYAPSPTGIPHVGNLRTALFNFLFARNIGGDFILRMEDTDQKRLVPGADKKIKESLKQLDLIWDEEIVQSKRLSIYGKFLKILQDKKLAYREEGAWRFKVEKGKKLTWTDEVHGTISFASDVIEDFVVIKSDGFPTYHFASTVDDYEMEISHVLRGDEWISSTPKHLLLYEAFGWNPPKFAHLPAIVGPDRKKLSKREGAKTVFEYLDEGFLPEAINNFLALLGWAPKGDKEIFSLEQLIKEFSIERINKNSPIFSIEKLRWFNNQWIKKMSDDALAEKIGKFFPNYSHDLLLKIAPQVKERIFTLKEFNDMAEFFFSSPLVPKIPSIEVRKSDVQKIIKSFESLSPWQAQNIKDLFQKVSEENGVDRIKMIAAVRNIISGKTITPPLYESMEILGKDETLKRLKEYVK